MGFSNLRVLYILLLRSTLSREVWSFRRSILRISKQTYCNANTLLSSFSSACTNKWGNVRKFHHGRLNRILEMGCEKIESLMDITPENNLVVYCNYDSSLNIVLLKEKKKKRNASCLDSHKGVSVWRCLRIKRFPLVYIIRVRVREVVRIIGRRPIPLYPVTFGTRTGCCNKCVECINFYIPIQQQWTGSHSNYRDRIVLNSWIENHSFRDTKQ